VAAEKADYFKVSVSHYLNAAGFRTMKTLRMAWQPRSFLGVRRF